MPPLGKIMGNVDFSDLFINLSGTPYPSLAAAKAAGAATINYGLFINTVIDFLIVGVAIFFTDQTGQSFEKTSRGCASIHQGMSVLPVQCAA